MGTPERFSPSADRQDDRMYPVAYVALLSFVVIGFVSVRSAPPGQRALRVALVYLAGQMFLPNRVVFDLPILPPIGKMVLSSTVPLLALASTPAGLGLGTKGFFRGPAIFIWVSVLGQLGTVRANPDALDFGPKHIVGLTLQDGVAFALLYFGTTGTAFYLGRALVRAVGDLKQLLEAILIMGLLQLPIVLIELRMSPQVHKWVYGFSVIGFANVVRGEGYKPVGFLLGGLAMAIFLFAAAAGAMALSRAGVRVWRFRAGTLLVPLWVVLAVSKNLGANVFAVAAYLASRFLTWTWTLRVAMILVLASYSYPYARSAGYVDVYKFTDWVAEKTPERAASLAFRFVNEDQMLARAFLRPAFGWGGYGRNKIFNDRGESSTVMDGAWIITLGQQGIVGLVGLFGLIGMPVFGWNKRLRQASADDRKFVAGVVLLHAFLLVDLLPNGYFLTLPAFVAGGLTGFRDATS